jgi:hypothetical protein
VVGSSRSSRTVSASCSAVSGLRSPACREAVPAMRASRMLSDGLAAARFEVVSVAAGALAPHDHQQRPRPEAESALESAQPGRPRERTYAK